MSKPLFERTSLKLGCNAEYDKTGTHKLIPGPDMYIFFEKLPEVEFLLFLIDIVKPTINI